MKKKILLLDQADFIGGAELFNLDLINNLDTEKFEIYLLFSGNPDYQAKINQHVNEFAYPLPRLKSGLFRYWHLLKSAWLVRTIVKREKIDLVQSNTIRMHIIAAFAKKLFRLKVKLIWFVHDFTFSEKFLKKLINIPDEILTCSEAVKKDLIQKTAPSFSSKIHTIYNGVLVKKVPKEDSQMKVLHNILKTGTTRDLTKKHKIGIIGRLDPWKGQDIFLKAAHRILEENPRFEFVIIGSASKYDQATLDFEKKLKAMVQEFGLEKSVKFLGYVEDLEKEMQKLDIVIHASKQAEPFGRVVIEAMNLGKIVIASNFGGTVEIIEHEQDGYLIPPDNVKKTAEIVLTILKKDKEMNKISNNARKKINQKFNLEKQVKKIEKQWEKLVISK